MLTLCPLRPCRREGCASAVCAEVMDPLAPIWTEIEAPAAWVPAADVISAERGEVEFPCAATAAFAASDGLEATCWPTAGAAVASAVAGFSTAVCVGRP